MATSSIMEQWEVNFARFVWYPASSSMAADSIHHPLLTPQSEICKKRRRGGVWISTPSATVKFIADFCTDSYQSVIMVTLGGKVMEEHYTSQLHISWPQVSCMSGFPARGTKAVILSYKDCLGQVQKFALRFNTLEETEKFIYFVKVIMEDIALPRAELNSGLSSEAEFAPCSEHHYRDMEDCILSDSADISTHVQGTPYSKATDHSIAYATVPNNSVEDIISHFPQSDSGNISTRIQVISDSKATDESNAYATIPNCEDFISDFPPSFSSFLKNCCPPPPMENPRTSVQEVDLKLDNPRSSAQEVDLKSENPRTSAQEVDLKSEFAKFLEDASFQDLLVKVENVVNELGDSIIF